MNKTPKIEKERFLQMRSQSTDGYQSMVVQGGDRMSNRP
jgi:hypothetical protein